MHAGFCRSFVITRVCVCIRRYDSRGVVAAHNRALEKADDAIFFERSPATRLLFSSLSGVFEKVLANDKGSERWSVRVARGALLDDLGCRARRRWRERRTRRRAPSFERSIVVLSPDADATFSLHEPLDARAIYVVGGLCDYRRVEGATLRRAAVASGDVVAKRLPIEDAFGTNASVNILTVNQTVEILSRVAATQADWRAALLETRSERKLRNAREVVVRDERRSRRRGPCDDDVNIVKKKRTIRLVDARIAKRSPFSVTKRSL